MGEVNRNLIFDIGVNEGFDSAFYLDKGFHVVGVEANPIIAAALRQALGHWIAEGRYTLVDKGIWSERGDLTFYMNGQESHWSSFVREAGTRNGTPYRELTIPCITVSDLISAYGVPHYMKIDIEGADRHVLESLRSESVLPTFISVEEYGLPTFDDMQALGYRGFKIIQQSDKAAQIPPFPPLEGVYSSRRFTDRDSGLFGHDLLGPWMSAEEACLSYTQTIRKEAVYIGPTGEWHDIHGYRRPS